jgi:magnesium chelatase subunit D
MEREAPTEGAERWAAAAVAAALFCVDPTGTGGVWLRAAAGPARDAWLALLRDLLPAASPLRRVPLHVSDQRLLGGLDLAATLQARRPVAERGLLATVDGGVLVVAMAERVTTTTVAHLTAVLDRGEVRLERDGFALTMPARVGVIALDEGADDDERLSAALADRLAFAIDLAPCGAGDAAQRWHTGADIAQARARLPAVVADDAIVVALCNTAAALGIGSARAALLALNVARAAAALDARDHVTPDDATLAARLVLAPRATRLPAAPAEDDDSADAAPPPPESASAASHEDEAPPPETDSNADAEPPANAQAQGQAEAAKDVVLDAARAAIPPGLLARLVAGDAGPVRGQRGGRSGATRLSLLRGRPAGVRRGEPRAGARLDVVATLRAAAPWQRLRRISADDSSTAAHVRVAVRREDFHVARYRQRAETTTLFVVDASGSSARNRLAEAKGAVELLLAECYVRRDRVALIAFRGATAEVLLPPTRSLVRAKRCLAALAGGGATPLAAGLDTATLAASAILRQGGTPAVVLLTDGRANMGRDGRPDRTRAADDAIAAARKLRGLRVAALLVDTSPRPQADAARLAEAMGARYLALPHADAAKLARAARTAVAAPGAAPRGFAP